MFVPTSLLIINIIGGTFVHLQGLFYSVINFFTNHHIFKTKYWYKICVVSKIDIIIPISLVAAESKCEDELKTQKATFEAGKLAHGGSPPVGFYFSDCEPSGNYKARQRQSYPPFFFCVDPKTGVRTKKYDCATDEKDRELLKRFQNYWHNNLCTTCGVFIINIKYWWIKNIHSSLKVFIC